MAHVMREDTVTLPRRAASAIAAGAPVRTSASATNEVLPVASANQRSIGVAIATAATYQTGVSVQIEGVARCYAAASVGVGALVGVGSTNGRLIPIAQASAGVQNLGIIGESQTPAADGEAFSVLLSPRGPVA